MKKIEKSYLVIIILFLLSIGFSVLSSNITISSVFNIADASWNIYLDRVIIKNTNTENSTYSLNSERDSLTLLSNLDTPGDYIEYSFLIVNDGTIDATLNDFTITGLNSYTNYVNYSLKYYNGTDVSEGDIIKSKTYKKIIFHIDYKYDISDFITISNLESSISFRFSQLNTDNRVWEYDFTEEIQTFVAPKTGTYKLEVWGAQGGVSNADTSEGFGGYSVGNVSLNKNDKLYILVGGSGTLGNKASNPTLYGGIGGYNGGGEGGLGVRTNNTTYRSGAGGGGATSIFLESDVSYFTATDLLGTTPTQYQQFEGTSVIYSEPANSWIWQKNIGRTIGEIYKVEWHGKGLSNPKLRFDGGVYLEHAGTFYDSRGYIIRGKKITDEIVELWIEVTENSYVTEFRISAEKQKFRLDYKSEIRLENPLIVAGGGGGCSWEGTHAGSGGGFQGVNSYYNDGLQLTASQGGTQSNGFFYGVGQKGKTKTIHGSYGAEGNGGAGGGYYGGSAIATEGLNSNSSGSGGSGYIGNSLLSNKAMYCYNCTESSDINTKTISTTNRSNIPTSNYAKKGNGYARITYMN